MIIVEILNNYILQNNKLRKWKTAIYKDGSLKCNEEINI